MAYLSTEKKSNYDKFTLNCTVDELKRFMEQSGREISTSELWERLRDPGVEAKLVAAMMETAAKVISGR